MLCLKNAIPIDQVSVLDRAFHYGDGCFTTARIRNGIIELKELHYKRLRESCNKLMLNADLDLIHQSILKLSHETQSLNGTLKIIISRGEGQRGYGFSEKLADLWMFYYPSHDIEDDRYQVISSGILQNSIGLTMPHLVGIKTLNRLEQVILRKEADQRAWQEALVSDSNGQIVEGVSSNCFLLINDTWVCPELRYNGVHGVMRAEILDRMNRFGVKAVQRSVDLAERSNIQSLFYCNALHPMKIASCLDDQALDIEPCIQLFNTLQLSQIR